MIASWLSTQLAADEMIIDCGAGRGALGACPELAGQVVGIDIRSQDDGGLSPILRSNAIEFDFNDRTVPVFIRPDHSGWVNSLLLRHIDTVGRAFYIGLEKNFETDLPEAGESYFVHEVKWLGWEGPEGEKIWMITRPFETMYEYVLWEDDRQYKQWFAVGPSRERGGYEAWRDNGSMYFIDPTESAQILKHFVYPGEIKSLPRGGSSEGFEYMEEKRQDLVCLSSYYLENVKYREDCLAQVESRKSQWLKFKSDKGRVIEVPEAVLLANSMEIQYSNEPVEKRESISEVWVPVSPHSLKQTGDSRYHSDLMFTIKVDGEFLEDIFCWREYTFTDVRNAIEDARCCLGWEHSLDGDEGPSRSRPMEGRSFSRPFTYLCGDPKRVITGTVQRPKPGEEVEPGCIAVCSNGSINFDRAIRSANAAVVGAGGATCHLVTVSRPLNKLIVRFDYWELLVDGDVIEIDVPNRIITLMKEGPDALSRISGKELPALVTPGSGRPLVGGR
jgi:hypothetical protein